jgi:hypothetical protein
MLNASAMYALAAQARLQRIVCRIDVLARGALVHSGLRFAADGQCKVHADRSAWVRRTASITVTDPLGPSLLNIADCELRIWRGLVRPDLASEYVCLGTFGIQEIDDTLPASGLAVTLSDRCQRVDEDVLMSPVTVSGSAVSAIRQLCLDSVPWATFEVAADVIDANLPPVVYDTTRTDAIQKIATSIGVELFCDVFGGFRLQSIPGLDDPVAWMATTITKGSRTLSRADVINGVKVQGQTTGSAPAPSSGLIVDDDPTSPTYWGSGAAASDSPFGRKGAVYTMSEVADENQAIAAARAILRDNVGYAAGVSFSGAADSRYEPGDVFMALSVDPSKHILESVDFPLDASAPDSGTSRARPVTAVTS